jgi:hypothetical protein
MKIDQDRAPWARNWEWRQRIALVVLLVIATASTLILWLVLSPPGPEGNAVDLELARDQAGFMAVFNQGWRQDTNTLCGLDDNLRPDGHATDGAYFGTLRCHLFADSLGLVPGYVGLLVFFTLLLARIAGVSHVLAVHALCIPAIAAGVFDIAENGMTILAAENLMDGLLVDATVMDVRLASVWKWSLAAAAFAVVGLVAWRAAPQVLDAGLPPVPLRIAAAGAGLAALVMIAGLVWGAHVLLGYGMLPGAIALLVLGGWRLRQFRAMPTLVGA